jgi:hypothetical protein
MTSLTSSLWPSHTNCADPSLQFVLKTTNLILVTEMKSDRLRLFVGWLLLTDLKDYTLVEYMFFFELTFCHWIETQSCTLVGWMLHYFVCWLNATKIKPQSLAAGINVPSSPTFPTWVFSTKATPESLISAECFFF